MAINFKINDKPYEVLLANHPVDMSLNTFIRQHAHLTGTKFMCLEAGCGVCVCVIRKRHPDTNEIKTMAVNSCLTLLNVCDGWEIVTIEGLGNRKDGYHPLQKRLADMNGSQCGYCSPAMIMNMYGLLESNGGQLTMDEIENSFGGNICRCTGYRAILDAMKSFATDSPFEYVDLCRDIEDLSVCKKTGEKCMEACKKKKFQYVFKDNREWHQIYSINQIFQIFDRIDDRKYILVAGYTAHGVYRNPPDIEVFIDVNRVAELQTYSLGNVIEIGANIRLNEMIEIMQKASSRSGFEYCAQIARHLDLVAHVPVRNVGAIAGNLTIKHEHKEFPSDVFLLLETVNARLVIMQSPSDSVETSPKDFLQMDMRKKIITKIILEPRRMGSYLFNSYKIMIRAQNTHAMVNAGFLLNMANDKIDSARICFGAINPEFIHAENTESFLIGKEPFTNETLQGALTKLQAELNPDWRLPDPSPAYRRQLSYGLFYKFILNAASESLIKPEYRSGGGLLERPLSNGTQVFDSNKERYPLTQPMPKLESLAQCSGEAEYINDVPPIPGELWAAFVHATHVNSKIAQIDASEALKMPGVVAFYSAKDIPGKNSFVYPTMLTIVENEKIFCDDEVEYYDQPAGVIVAESMDLANEASKKVKILYEKQREPVMSTMQDVFKHKAFHRIKELHIDRDEKLVSHYKDPAKHIEGIFDLGSQYHYTMEPQTCICIPTEDGIEVYPASQWLDATQTAIARMLNMNKSSVVIAIRRVGGAFGSKITRNSQIACACALACKLLNRPIRFVQSIESTMGSIGKRFACFSEYKVDVDSNGKIRKLTNDFYEDSGASYNETPTLLFTVPGFHNCYAVDLSWLVLPKTVKTNAPSHTWCRAPGSLEGIAMIENIMEHIACETDQDPVDVRIRNLQKDTKMESLIPDFLRSSDYRNRKRVIDEFNMANRWRKRGLGFSLMNFTIFYFGIFQVTVSIYQADGSVAISHSGTEIGQGIHTKATQVAAYILGIPLDSVKVLPANSLNGANGTLTGGSIGSEAVCNAIKKACEELLARLKPFLHKNWQQAVQAAYILNISLTATASSRASDLKGYPVWGLCASEVEVDILTGKVQVPRVDILEDTGESLNPTIDVGQIEGAFIMGLGYWLTEKLVFNRETGELVSNRTWDYKPPGAKDIPIDFRVTLLRNSSNTAGFLRSKATGEPAICLAVSAMFAIRHALTSSRADAGISDKWIRLGAPTTPEEILLSSGTSPEMFKLN